MILMLVLFRLKRFYCPIRFILNGMFSLFALTVKCITVNEHRDNVNYAAKKPDVFHKFFSDKRLDKKSAEAVEKYSGQKEEIFLSPAVI